MKVEITANFKKKCIKAATQALQILEQPIELKLKKKNPTTHPFQNIKTTYKKQFIFCK